MSILFGYNPRDIGMQEWDPEHFTNFAQLCEVSLATIREKTDAERLYLWLKAPNRSSTAFSSIRG